MKTRNKPLLLCMAVYALAVTAAAQTTWKLSKDLLATNNQISFNQGSNGVWYFLQSRSFKQFPKTYKFLSLYSSPCKSNPIQVLIDGVTCWINPDLDADGNNAPLVAINATYATQVTNNIPIPPRSVTMHPGMSKLGIVGWKSPITGLLNIAGFFSDLDPNCGNGIIWSVDKGSQTLTSGTIANGGPPQSYSLTGISVVAGQVLYFVVDPNGDYHCDTTGVDVTISKTP